MLTSGKTVHGDSDRMFLSSSIFSASPFSQANPKAGWETAAKTWSSESKQCSNLQIFRCQSGEIFVDYEKDLNRPRFRQHCTMIDWNDMYMMIDDWNLNTLKNIFGLIYRSEYVARIYNFLISSAKEIKDGASWWRAI